ncbi:MAG: ribosome maturation factor RimP [Gammaproteobacteria bacterium]|jgi:ribosome maturation factor RimP|nr:ribosome maturation factor RimP [Gammaproteobacteria bacterium]
MSNLTQKLYEMLLPAVEAVNFELWGIEYIPQGQHSILRVYIEHENGITVDDCEVVSKQISAVLDVEDPITAHYSLEVSSPGLDRFLFYPHQYHGFIGEQLAVRLRLAVNNQRKYTGKLIAVSDKGIELEAKGTSLELDWNNIEKAQVVPSFTKNAGRVEK